ncbi:MAG: nucleotidyltransferase [Actinobacteria bacterium]|nr:nucleotidyltransferase [Actinomycetota bacterium]
MRPSVALQAHRQEVRDIVSAHRATNPRVFGSAARGDDTSESDLDLLIDPTAETSLLDVGAIRHELLVLLGMTVDVLTPKALPPRFRDSVLAEAVPV